MPRRSRKAGSEPPPADLLKCVPERIRDAEEDGDKVVVLRPRFLRGPLAWWLQPRLSRPYFRVHLDEVGSFVWRSCDGQRSVAGIAAAMEAHFGDAVKPAFERLQLFLYQLEQGQMIRVRPPEDGSSER